MSILKNWPLALMISITILAGVALIVTAPLGQVEEATKIPKLKYTVLSIRAATGQTVYLSPYLIPSLLIDKNITYEDYRAFIDIIVKRNYGTTLKAFSAGCWEPETQEVIRFPYKVIRIEKSGRRIFDLNQWDDEWWKETIKRIRYYTKRGGMVIYTLIDGCSLHPDRPKSHWSRHFWNGNNNINGTATDKRAIRFMFRCGDSPDEYPDMAVTKKYVLKYLRTLVRRLEKKFPRKIIYDFNECGFEKEWYLRLNQEVFDKYNIPTKRKMVSWVKPQEDVQYLTDTYLYQPHGIDSLEKYNTIWRSFKWKIQPSADGSPGANLHDTKYLVYHILSNGDLGFENNRPQELNYEGAWEEFPYNMTWEQARGMKQGFLKWYRERVSASD